MRSNIFLIIIFSILLFNIASFSLSDDCMPVIVAIESKNYDKASQLISKLPPEDRATGIGLYGVISYLKGDYMLALNQFNATKDLSNTFLAGAILSNMQVGNISVASELSTELPYDNNIYVTLKFLTQINNNNYIGATMLQNRAEELKIDTPLYYMCSAFWAKKTNDKADALKYIKKFFESKYIESDIPLAIDTTNIIEMPTVLFIGNDSKTVDPYIELKQTPNGGYCYTVKGLSNTKMAVEYRSGSKIVGLEVIPPYQLFTVERVSNLTAAVYDVKNKADIVIKKVVEVSTENDNLAPIEKRIMELIFPQTAPKGWLSQMLDLQVKDNDVKSAVETLEAMVVSGSADKETIAYLNMQYKRLGIYPPPIRKVISGDQNKKQVALTFDDGPNPIYTPIILETLKKYNAKGTFFVVGKMVEKYPETTKMIVKEGCELDNHSQTHPNITKLSNLDVLRELLACRITVRNVTGVEMPFFRPPGGNINPALEDTINTLGFGIGLWSINAGEFVKNTPEEQVRLMMGKVRNGSVILMHNGPVDGTTAMLDLLLSELTREGYKLVTLSEIVK